MMAGLATASMAQADDMKVTFSGSLDYQFAFTDADQEANGDGVRIGAVADQSELVWDAQGIADNGLEYGANVQWRYVTGNGGAFDEAYLSFGGDWGLVRFGADDDVVDNMATGANDVMAHSEGFDGEFGDYYTQIGDAGAIGTSGSSGDANKVAYYTQDFAGFQGGVSFTPHDGDTFQIGGADNGTGHNIIETAVGYGGSFGDIDVGASLGYRHGTAEDGTSGNELEDHSAWRLGGIVSVAGFHIGAGYGDNGDSACLKNTSCDAGDNYQLGLGYDHGLGRVAVGYAHGDNTNNNGTKDTIEVMNLSADFGLAEGLTAYGDLVHVQSDNGTAGAANENEGTIFLMGVVVTF